MDEVSGHQVRDGRIRHGGGIGAMNLQRCPVCHRSIWDDQLDATINARFSPAYCQCLSITIHLTSYTVEVLKSLSRQLAPEKTAVPLGIYDAFTDEEVSL